jgi:hypothetical protein
MRITEADGGRSGSFDGLILKRASVSRSSLERRSLSVNPLFLEAVGYNIHCA